jgi:uncharacterized phage protein (TIGR01671 family)
MYRSIKFRGKKVTNGEWVYGCLTEIQQDQIAIYDNRPRASSLDVWTYIRLNTYEVIPETVGQFTGLVDKKGEEIYEGDILANAKRQKQSFVIVEWGKEEAGFYLYNTWTGHTIYPPLEGIFIKIGNIHDNPELL